MLNRDGSDTRTRAWLIRLALTLAITAVILIAGSSGLVPTWGELL